MIVTIKAYYRDPGYLVRVLIALDEFGAAVLDLPNNVTVSSWCGLWERQKGWRRWLGHFGYWTLDRIQYHHCEGAVVHDEERAEVILAYLKREGVIHDWKTR